MGSFDVAVKAVQFLSVDGVEAAGCGHPGTPMALATVGVELFTRHLRYDPQDPTWPNRDRFVLSCGHASMLQYSLLHLAGYDVSIDDLRNFRQWGSKTPGHPEYGHTAGVECTTGPLGQGIAMAVGMALGSKMLASRVNTPDKTLIDYRVFAIASDGDLMEGVSAEAASLAGHLGLGNLIVVYDDNKITIDGRTDLAFSEDVGKRFQAQGWHVLQADGHDVKSVRTALEQAAAETKRPSIIVTRTHIGYGSPNKQDTSEAHGAALGAAEVELTKKALDWPTSPAFYAPDEAYEPFRQHVAAQKDLHAKWNALVESLPADQATLWNQFNAAHVPEDIFEQLVETAKGIGKDATRSISFKIQQRVAELVPSLVGGSADLVASVKSTIKGGGDVKAGEFAGRNVHFGIREHAMGAIANGLSLSGFTAYTGTFLIFCEYMKPAIRLAAIMHQPVIFIYSHDSIHVGEDGPTHQPVEQLASLRLIPELDLFRPADALECAAAWAHALARWDAPTAFSLTRQSVPALERPSSFEPSQILQGGYVVTEADDPDFVLIATGSEVHLAVEAQGILAKKGKRARVVSMPCLELFERQPAEVQESVLGTGIRRVAIEAGATGLWRGVVGLDGICIGIDRFGASAPGPRIAAEFGITGEHIAEAILAS